MSYLGVETLPPTNKSTSILLTKYFPFWILSIHLSFLFAFLSKGEQNALPPNMPLWHIDYFELKLLEK